jgi:hypothetical protein
MKRIEFKRLVPYLVAIVVFVGIAVAYCSPLLEGKVLSTSDGKGWEGTAQEAREYKNLTGETTWWTNSLFAGMPTYQITGSMPSVGFVSKVLVRILHLGFVGVLGLIIGYFIGFFILLRCFEVNKWLSIVGAIAFAFSTYFLIILAAGHMTKADTLGLIVPIIGGFYLIFQKKYWLGFPITAIYSTAGIYYHPQMSYYVFMLIGVLVLLEIYLHIKERRWKDLGIGLALLSVALLISVGTRYSWLSANQEYLAETMRGGHSELNQPTTDEEKKEGLDLDYATAWSYGIDETLTLMIPNFMGGASSQNVGTSSEVYKAMTDNGIPRKSAESFCSSLPTYWGSQPFTSGPVYVGAIICFLFLLGLIIVQSPYKWALLFATICSILLAWGHNFMWLTEWFFNYFPMYNKFRAVSSILVVAEITMPLLAFLALQEIINGKISKQQITKGIYWSGGITASLCLFVALFGGAIWTFSSPNDAQMFSQLPEWLTRSIVEERRSMLVSDAWRSFIFIVLSAGVVWFWVNKNLKFSFFVAILGVLILADMVPVNKRYFNDENFVSEKNDRNFFTIQPYEKQILRDKDPHFRVMNLTTNTFNDARTSYRLKSIGGYHAVKLRRYQDLIDEHLSQFNFNVLNMLNTKYFIVKNAEGKPEVQYNPDVMGNAWFVDSLKIVDSPREESDALYNIDLKTTAILDKKFEDFAQQSVTENSSTCVIRLTRYAPNQLEYVSETRIPKTAVFSEIYYPHGWKAYIDDVPQEHFRVNYVLRAINVPAGKHTIRFEFKPDSIYKKDGVSVAFLILLGLLCVGSVGGHFYTSRKKIDAD